MENEEQMNMIKKIMEHTTSSKDGGFAIDENENECLFCEEKKDLDIPFHFMVGEGDYYLDVPMCERHSEIFQKDLYHIKL